MEQNNSRMAWEATPQPSQLPVIPTGKKELLLALGVLLSALAMVN